MIPPSRVALTQVRHGMGDFDYFEAGTEQK
jgi:hypothetical protein